MLIQLVRRIAAAAATLAAATCCIAQQTNPLEFQFIGNVQPGWAIFVVGDTPQLGDGDVRYSLKLEPRMSPQWRISVEVPAGSTINYRYVLREFAPGRLSDSANAINISTTRTVSTADVAAQLTSKLVFARIAAPHPVLRYRPRRTPLAPFTELPMERFGPGRSAGESTYVSVGAGALDEEIEFYFADDSAGVRDPQTGTYSTSLRSVYVQDARLFTYQPADQPVGNSGSDPSTRPFEIYDMVGASEASGYPVLDRSGCAYRQMMLFSSHALGLYPDAGPHMIMLAPDGKDGYMARHLAKVETDVVARVIDPDYDGLLVIDYESWWPNWSDHPNNPSSLPYDALDEDQPDDWRDYIRTHRPELIAGLTPDGQEAVFRSTWLQITREFIEGTIRRVKQVRPRAKVAMYDMPNQDYWGWRTPGYAEHRHAIDDTELGWLFDLQDVIVGGAYTHYYAIANDLLPALGEDTEQMATEYFNNVIDECIRNSRGKPVYLFVMPVYQPGNPVYRNLPLNDFNLRAMLEIPYQRAINGVIVWGWVRDQADAAVWTSLYHDRFTPYMRTLFQRPRVLAGVTSPVGGTSPTSLGPSPARRDYGVISPPTIQSNLLGETRTYRVILPRGYAEHPERSYPVVFFQDGQDIFDQVPNATPWNVKSTMLAAVERGEAREAILVAVDSGPNRLLDYTPPESGGRANVYTDFLRQELLPVIESRYRTLPGRQAIGLIGAGAGGQGSFYGGWTRPETFSRIGAMSGTWRTNSLAFYNRVLTDSPRPLRVYLDSGDIGADYDVYGLTLALRDNLAAKPGGPLVTDRDLRWVVGFGQHPVPSAWGPRLPEAFKFLYPASEENGPLLSLFSKRLDLDGSSGVTIDDLAYQSRLPADLDISGQADAADTSLLERSIRAGEGRQMGRWQR